MSVGWSKNALKSSSGPCLKFLGSSWWTEEVENVKHTQFVFLQLAKFMEWWANDVLAK